MADQALQNEISKLKSTAIETIQNETHREKKVVESSLVQL